jgi:prepilin-type N-terminal cleavage/methylation domain-containing protein
MMHARRSRRGFTLVELLVAAAMMILGMWLLSWVYQQGLESFRQARAQADLTAQQRMVTSVLTRDLHAAHFADEDGKPNRGRRLSDQTQMWFDPAGYTPPKGGFFRAGSFDSTVAGNTPEGSDLDGFASSRSTNHFLQFTAILPGGPSHQLFSAEVPANSGSSGQYFGTAAEILYYLTPNGQATPGGLPLYDLCRQQRLVARDNDDAPAYAGAVAWLTASPPDNVNEVMVLTQDASGNPKMATLAEVTVPMDQTGANGKLGVRLRGPSTFTPLATTSARYGSDRLMSSVLSFEVKFTGASADPNMIWPRPFSQNSDYPYDTLPYDGVIDTFSDQVAPNWKAPTNYASGTNVTGPLKPLRITGVQIRLRTYDARTRSTRQTTIVQDL